MSTDQAALDELMKEIDAAPESQTGAGEDGAIDAQVDAPISTEPPQQVDPAPAEASTDPATTQPEQQQPNGQDQQRMVPYDAMYAERAKRQDLERELEAFRANSEQTKGEVAAMKEMLQSELSRREEAKKAADEEANRPQKLDYVKVPDPDDDDFSIKAYHEALNKNAQADRHNMEIDLAERAKAEAAALLQEQMAPINEAYSKHQETLEQQAKDNELLNVVGQREQMYAAEKPDYYEAVKAYKMARFEDFQSLGLPPQQALTAVQNEMKTQAQQFIDARMDPAQSWYALATRRGWNGQSQPQPQNGALAEQQQQRPAGQPSVETMKRGMEASDGLANASQAGGAIQSDPAKALDKMLDLPDSELIKRMEELDALTAKVFR